MKSCWSAPLAHGPVIDRGLSIHLQHHDGERIRTYYQQAQLPWKAQSSPVELGVDTHCFASVPLRGAGAGLTNWIGGWSFVSCLFSLIVF
jgi:hypothetical protein